MGSDFSRFGNDGNDLSGNVSMALNEKINEGLSSDTYYSKAKEKMENREDYIEKLKFREKKYRNEIMREFGNIEILARNKKSDQINGILVRIRTLEIYFAEVIGLKKLIENHIKEEFDKRDAIKKKQEELMKIFLDIYDSSHIEWIQYCIEKRMLRVDKNSSTFPQKPKESKKLRIYSEMFGLKNSKLLDLEIVKESVEIMKVLTESYRDQAVSKLDESFGSFGEKMDINIGPSPMFRKYVNKRIHGLAQQAEKDVDLFWITSIVNRRGT